MKKYFLFGLIVAIMPSICFGSSARYTQLVREKQRKMAELEKCMGATNGLKIAGLSTLGLTAVGVAGNVAEAQKIKEYDEYIEEKAPKALARIETSIAEEKEKLESKDNTNTNSTKRYIVVNGKTVPTKIEVASTDKQPKTVEQLGQDALFGDIDTNLHLDVPTPVQAVTDSILIQGIQEVTQTDLDEINPRTKQDTGQDEEE